MADIDRQRLQHFLQLAHREIATGTTDIRSLHTAASRLFLEIELFRAHPCKPLDPLAERIEAHQLGLHLTQFNCHHGKIFLEVFLALVIVALRHRCYQLVQHGRAFSIAGIT